MNLAIVCDDCECVKDGVRTGVIPCDACHVFKPKSLLICYDKYGSNTDLGYYEFDDQRGEWIEIYDPESYSYDEVFELPEKLPTQSNLYQMEKLYNSKFLK